MIESVEINGFRNFPSKRLYRVNFIPEGFILVGGGNAIGKTSLYLSLGFIFAGSKGFFSPTRIRDLVNYKSHVNHARVTITLRNKAPDGTTMFPGVNKDYIKIDRLLGKKDSSYDYIKIDDTIVNQAELRSFLKQAHIDANNPYQFVGQGQLASIIDKSPEERLNLLDIFIPASETAKKFLEGLREIRTAKRSFDKLNDQERQLTYDESIARENRNRYEKKVTLQKNIEEAHSFWAYSLCKEYLSEKNSTNFELTEAKRRIQAFSEVLKRDKSNIENKKSKLENVQLQISKLKKQRKAVKNQKADCRNKKGGLERKIARLIQLENELRDQEYISLPEAKEKLEQSQKFLIKAQDEVKIVKDQLKEIETELDLLYKKVNTPLAVRSVLKKAEKLGISAIFTFDGVEWAINDFNEKKRLEIIFKPLRNSITVSNFSNAQKLLNAGVEIPVLIAHSTEFPCDYFIINGFLAESRKALFKAIEKEWGSMQPTILPQYSRQLLSSGFVVNLAAVENRSHVTFIGTEGLKKREELLSNDLKRLQSRLPHLQKILQDSDSAYSVTLANYHLAEKFNERAILTNENATVKKEIKLYIENISNLEEEEEQIIHTMNETHQKLEALKKDMDEIRKKIEKFNLSIQETENQLSSLEKKAVEANEKYKSHLENFSEAISMGEKIALKKAEKIGTSSGYKADFDRFNKELATIGEVPENAIEHHDSVKKRLERFRIQTEQQRDAADINPEKVREDLHEYERMLNRYINNINLNLKLIMEEFNAEARFILKKPVLDEDKWEYNPGIKIRVKFRGKEEVEVDKYCSLSGGEKTRLIVGILLALIRSQEQRHTLPFLILDEFDAQLDEPGHKQVMELLHKEIGAKQLIIFSPNRLEDKAIVADMILNFTNPPHSAPEIKVLAIRQREKHNALSTM